MLEIKKCALKDCIKAFISDSQVCTEKNASRERVARPHLARELGFPMTQSIEPRKGEESSKKHLSL